jgi:hypothetical protein
VEADAGEAAIPPTIVGTAAARPPHKSACRREGPQQSMLFSMS